jgi:hypothetical protein
MRYGADLTTKPLMTLADIGRLAREQPELFYTRSGSVLAPTPQEVPDMPSTEATVDSAQSQGA